jgi:hypothetical protein
MATSINRLPKNLQSSYTVINQPYADKGRLIKESMRKKLVAIGLMVALAGVFPVIGASPQQGDDNPRNEDNNVFGGGGPAQELKLMPVPPGKREEKFARDVEKWIDKLDKDFNSFSRASENVPSSLVVTPAGRVRLTNSTVSAINGTNLTLSLWGINLNVDASNARLLNPRVLGPQVLAPTTSTSTASSTISDIKVGDRLAVEGTIDSTNGTIKAERILDYSLQRQTVSEIQARIQQLLQLLEQLRAQLRGGGR